MDFHSIHFSGYSCFGENWTGVEKFKPLTLVIGRNNTGKSRFLDLIQILTRPSKEWNKSFVTRASALLGEEFLASVFSKRQSGGGLGPNYSQFFEQYSHYNSIGKHFLATYVEWQADVNRAVIEETLKLDAAAMVQVEPWRNQVRSRLAEGLLSASSPYLGLQFLRMQADRDVEPEKASKQLSISPNGRGATNLIRRFLLSSQADADVIRVNVLNALSDIFGSDAEFEGIEVREHEGSKPDGSDDVWEVFLKERRKRLVPLSQSGSGIKTVLLVLLNLIAIPIHDGKQPSSYVFAFEELENNLHPSLLRRLLEYISSFVVKHDSTLYLTAHSNVALDFFGLRSDAQIICVEHDKQNASARTLTTHFDRVGMLAELGARPSDLLQANGIVWVEGPSDRIYIDRFISIFSDGELIEGRDYQCAYYGGALLANCQVASPESQVENFVNLLAVNNNVAVICDGDRTATKGEKSKLKTRVERIASEIAKIPDAFIWITEAKEIENYIPGSIWSTVYAAPGVPDPSRFDRFPSSSDETSFVSKHLKRKFFDKCDFALRAAPLLTKELLQPRFELSAKIRELVDLIRTWKR